ncbi:MAG: hypothetical protein K9H11_22600, partial [Rhodospirillum sp.]|nr:hypothetical protein [Rhodospirillum sp.]
MTAAPGKRAHPGPPVISEEGEPSLAGLNARVADQFWPYLQTLEKSFIPYKKVDWDRRYKAGMPYILGGFIVFILLAVLGGPVVGIGLLGFFFLAVPVFLVVALFGKGKAPPEESSRTLEKRAVQRLVELMGFTWIGTAPSEGMEHERRALSLLGLMPADGKGVQAHFEDMMALPDSGTDLKIFDLIVHSSAEARENVATHWFRGLVLSFDLPRSVDGLILGQGRRRGMSR